MGNFHSMICANRKNIGVEETDKEQIEETPMVKIHLKCPSNKGSSHSQQELSQDIDTAEAVESCSVEALDIVSYSGSDDEWSSDSLSSQSEDECDTPSAAEDQLQVSFTLEVRGKKCLPRHTKITGLGQQNGYMHSYTLAPVESPTNWRNERYSRRGKSSNGGYRSVAREYPGLLAPQRARKFSFPAPRPSQWQWMYSKLLKPREQLANESLKKKQLKKKEVHREDGTRARNGRLMEKKIRKSVKSKVAEDSKSGPRCHGSPSSSSAASVIHKTSPTRNNDYTNGRSRKFSRGRINKVPPI